MEGKKGKEIHPWKEEKEKEEEEGANISHRTSP